MKSLSRPAARYRRQLQDVLNARESARYASEVASACALAATYSRSSPRLHRLRTNVAHRATRTFFIGLYDKRRAAIQAIKDGVRAGLDAVTSARCQYCGLSEPESLDHYLEKAKIPELSLFARNLIPCCPYCNTNRGPAFTPTGERRILHFYDDEIDAMPDVLTASVRIAPSSHPVVTYSIAASSHPLVEVYRRHFDALHLASRYERESRGQLRVKRDEVQRAMPLTRTVIVAKLRDQARSQAAIYGPNYFLAAMYEALAASRAAVDWLMT